MQDAPVRIVLPGVHKPEPMPAGLQIHQFDGKFRHRLRHDLPGTVKFDGGHNLPADDGGPGMKGIAGPLFAQHELPSFTGGLPALSGQAGKIPHQPCGLL